MLAIDWTHIYKNYKGLWVALKDDEVTVISAGKSLKETSKKAEKKGFKEPILRTQEINLFCRESCKK